MPEIGSEAEAHMAVERLLDKLEAWVLQQPEALLIWAQPRHTRKDVAHAIADIMTHIPTREAGEAMNRSGRKRLLAALDKADREWWKGINV